MITPVFWITQDPNKLNIRIRAPHANLAEFEIDHGEYSFLFSCKPYFLRIYFKQMIDEFGNGRSIVNYNSENDEFVVQVFKLHRNEDFTHLDMITELLKPTDQSRLHGRSWIEEEEEDEKEEVEFLEGNEYLVEQNPIDIKHEVQKNEKNIKKYGYGFGWKKIGIIERLREEIGKIVELIEPENMEICARSDEAQKIDVMNFDGGRYLADTLDPEEELMSIIKDQFQISIDITTEDREKLKDIPALKTHKLLKEQENFSIGLSLIDIIYGYCYDQRVNQWDKSCESGWTVAKLSPSLAYLVQWSSVDEAIQAAIRRSLCYPLYRNWNLAIKVVEDVKKVFENGRSTILHILCDIHRIFIESGEFRYILNDLFITDYIRWIQSVSEDILEKLTKKLMSIGIVEKKQIDELDLEMLEIQANMETILDSDDDENF